MTEALPQPTDRGTGSGHLSSAASRAVHGTDDNVVASATAGRRPVTIGDAARERRPLPGSEPAATSSAFGEQARADAAAILARYPAGRERSALGPLLHLVQSLEGYVSPAGIRFCADVLGITTAEVGAFSTFYTMYKRRPVGDYVVSVCTNTLCGMLGGDEIFGALSEHLGVGHDEPTPDGTLTFEHAECLAACDYAPVVTVNYEFFDNQTVDSALDLVRRLQGGERPQPTRGARLCTFKEIERQLAGFPDERTGALADGPPGAPTLAGLRLAQQRGERPPAFPDGSRFAASRNGAGGGAAAEPQAPGATPGGAAADGPAAQGPAQEGPA